MVELLAIVEAEQAADALLKSAEEERAAAIKQAMEDRKRALQEIAAPQPREIALPPLDPKLETLRALAQQNRQRAVAKILEEFYAP